MKDLRNEPASRPSIVVVDGDQLSSRSIVVELVGYNQNLKNIKILLKMGTMGILKANQVEIMFSEYF